MSDYSRDTPSLGRSYCPGCEPDTNPLCEILDTRWCDAHLPDREGPDDRIVDANTYLVGSTECGDGNAAWCAFFHGRA